MWRSNKTTSPLFGFIYVAQEEGWTADLAEGRAEGMILGIEQGIKRGIEQAVIILLQNGYISPEVAAAQLKININELDKYL